MNNYLIAIIIKNIKLLTIVGVVSVIVTIIFSSPIFIKPEYQSQAIVYPSNLGSYSGESSIEQMVQWFDSKYIKESVIKALDLQQHYNIDDAKDNLKNYYLLKRYDKNVSAVETKYESAKITAIDTDPKIAYKIVKAELKYFNKLVRTEHRKRAQEVLNTVKIQFDQVKTELDSVSKELKNIRIKYGIINYNAQSGEVMRGYLGTFDGSNKSSSNQKEIKKLIKNIEEKGGDFIVLDQRVYHLLAAYKYWENEYKKAKRSVDRKITYTNIVTAPSISYKKVYPIRWLIVLVSTLATSVFTLIILLLNDRFKKIKM